MSSAFTEKFATRTEFIKRNNGEHANSWPIGIDVGYSSVKMYSPNMIGMFPSYAVKMDASKILGADEDLIFYEDCMTGESWIVGKKAQVSDAIENESEEALYSSEWFFNPRYLVLMRCAIGIGYTPNEFGSPNGKKISIQTGLPPKYINSATHIIELLTSTCGGRHHFRLTVGTGITREFDFVIRPEDVSVIWQPLGTLYSVSFNKDGSFVPDAQKYMSSRVLIFDAGFGTLDTFEIANRMTSKEQTFPQFGMRQVLNQTSELIASKYNYRIPVPQMQEALETGTFNLFTRSVKGHSCMQKDVEPFLREASRSTCYEAIQTLMDIYKFEKLNYLIVTGGTGAAWNQLIRNNLKDMANIRIIDGNQNDEQLSFVYANVRGYYYYRSAKIKAAEKKAA